MRDIDDIVKDEIIDTIDNTLTITSSEQIGITDSYVLTFCDMKYLRLFTYITFGVYTYNIVSIDGNEVTILNPSDYPILKIGDIVTLQVPYYFRGTRKAVNSEFKIASEDMEKLPMIWLLNPVQETFFRKDPRERSSDIRMFLLCSADFVNDLTKDFREENITPLLALAESIFQSVNVNRKTFVQLESYTTRDFSKFGVEDNTGVIKSIIDSNVSGIDLRFTLETLTPVCDC